MNLELRNKVVLVTGAAQGMGLAAAEMFALEGATVVLADFNGEVAEQQAKRLKESGHQALAIQCDVTDEQQVKAMIDKTVATFGRLDAAFNNAGVQSAATETADATSAEFERVVGINLKGVWNCMKYELLQMRQQGSGSIVNNSSIGGLIGLPGRAIYHAAKHGVIGLTKSAALEYAAKGIRVNAVCPGVIETPMVTDMLATEPELMDGYKKAQPIGRLGKPEEVAAAVVWLCGSGSAFVLGQALAVDGGFTAQ